MYRAIIQPPVPTQPGWPSATWSRRYYKPQCSQYNNFPIGEVRTSPDGMITVGNCSYNEPGTPWDFTCYTINGQRVCHASNGRVASSYQQICCPQQRQQRPSCCRGSDYNACALCLDRREGTTDAANHQRNMERCRRSCGLF